jgi:uncharacterized repeat protein (TIGR01451 family)
MVPIPCSVARGVSPILGLCVALGILAAPAWPTTYVSAPASLSKTGETYVVTQDFSSSGDAFTITADNVVLDLNGHTVTYGTGGGLARGVYSTAAGTTVKNGTLTQAAGNSTSACHGLYHPYGSSTTGLVISGVTFNTHSTDSRGVMLSYCAPGTQIYNCIFNTSVLASSADNGCAAIHCEGSSFGSAAARAAIHDNTVNTATRPVMLVETSYVDVYDNELHPQAPAVNPKNSYGIWAWGVHHCRFYLNTITTSSGRGILLDGGATYNEVYQNTITCTDTQGLENIFGLRVRYGSSYNNLHENIVTVDSTAASPQQVAALFLGQEPGEPVIGNQIWGNTFQCDFRGSTSGSSAIYLGNCGTDNVIRNNTITSDTYNLWLEYASDSVLFESNTIGKGSNPRSDYHTIHMWDSAGPHTMLDATFSNGASLQSVVYGPNGGQLYVSWYLQVLVQDQSSQPVSGATVEIRDRNGTLVFSEQTAADGTVRPAIQQYTEAAAGDTSYTPHTVTATKTGYSTASTVVTVDASKQVVLSLAGGSGGVTLRKQANPTSTVPSGTITYTITYSNDTGGTINNVVVTDKIPAATTYVAGSAKLNGQPITPDPYQSGSLVISLGSLAAGVSGTIEFQVRVD